MYIDELQIFPASSITGIHGMFSALHNDKRKPEDQNHIENNSEILPETASLCDVLHLNCNNNSDVWDPVNVKPVSSNSFSIPHPLGNQTIFNKSDQRKSKKRWTSNRPRNSRSKGNDRSPKRNGSTIVTATQSSEPLNNSAKGPRAQSSRSAVSGCSLGRPNIRRNLALPEGSHLNSTGNIRERDGASNQQSVPYFPESHPHPADLPVVHWESKGAPVEVSLQQMLHQVTCYQRMDDIPKSLRHDLVDTICRPLVGKNSMAGTQSLPHPNERFGKRINNHVLQAGAEGGEGRSYEGAVDQFTNPEVPREGRPDTELFPFSTDFVFNQLYGSSYKRSYTFWQLRPPVLPSHIFTYKTAPDGAPFVIGVGTFGEVTVAWLDINKNRRQVAIKEPFVDLVPKDKVFEEAKMTMYLEPTGYVPLCYGLVYNALVPNYSIVLELFGSGITLRETLSRKDLSRLHWLSISRQLAEGLTRIHGMDVLVNDIKPDNVLVDLTTSDPVVKYCDMGCASYRCGITFDDANLDIFSHLAPEVKAGGQTSKASDVFGLGKILERVVQASVISGIVPISERCTIVQSQERATSGDALAMLNSVAAAEMKCVSTHEVVESESSDFQSSIGYDPDQDFTSGVDSVLELEDTRPNHFKVSPQVSKVTTFNMAFSSTIGLDTISVDAIGLYLFCLVSAMFFAFVRV